MPTTTSNSSHLAQKSLCIFLLTFCALWFTSCSPKTTKIPDLKADELPVAVAQKKLYTEDPKGYKVQIGAMVPDFKFTLTDGTEMNIRDLRGKPVMLQFTASWCGVCIKEMPHIEKEIWQAYKDKGMQVIGIDRDEPLEKAQFLIDKTNITYPLALDPGAEIFGLFADKKAGVTRNVIIDQQGRIVFLTRLFNQAEFDNMKGVIGYLNGEEAPIYNASTPQAVTPTKNSNPPTGIIGKLTNVDAQYNNIYLLKINTPGDYFNGSSALVIDSAAIDKDGHFQFPKFNDLDTTYVYRLNLAPNARKGGQMIRNYQSNNYVFLINEKHPIHIKADARAISRTYELGKTKGTQNHLLKEINQIEDVFYMVGDTLQPQLKAAKDQPEKLKAIKQNYLTRMMQYMDTVMLPNYQQRLEIETDPRIASIMMKNIDYDMDMENDLPYYDKVMTNFVVNEVQHPYVDWWKKEIHDAATFLPVGSKAPNFTLPTPNGGALSLYDTKAKLILIDFWASWCGPCRKENRKTVAPLYEKYKEQGFEVIGVSTDTEKESWLQAIEKDKAVWPQVGDLMGDQSPIRTEYLIKALPSTFLVDENFKVLAKNKKGMDLEKFVEAYLKNK